MVVGWRTIIGCVAAATFLGAASASAQVSGDQIAQLPQLAPVLTAAQIEALAALVSANGAPKTLKESADLLGVPHDIIQLGLRETDAPDLRVHNVALLKDGGFLFSYRSEDEGHTYHMSSTFRLMAAIKTNAKEVVPYTDHPEIGADAELRWWSCVAAQQLKTSC